MSITVFVRKTAEKQKKKEQWIYEAAALYLGAAAAVGESSLRSSDLRLRRTPKGKPFFENAGAPFFSVSHSGEYWACAMTDRPVGLDIQLHRGNHVEAVAARFFHPLEKEWLEEAGQGRFFDVWAAKESYVKYTGRGIDETFSRFSAIESGQPAESICTPDGTGWLCFVPFEETYSMCVCSERPESAELVWLAQKGQETDGTKEADEAKEAVRE